jgi:hypothetical protein
MIPGTRVAIERPPCATAEHTVADRLTGRTGTVTRYTAPWAQVQVDGIRGSHRTIRDTQLEILSTPTGELDPTPGPNPHPDAGQQTVDFAAELAADQAAPA